MELNSKKANFTFILHLVPYIKINLYICRRNSFNENQNEKTMIKRTFFFMCALLLAVAAQAQWDFSADKDYVLKHVTSGKYLVLHDSYEESNVVNATTLEGVGSLFTITKSGSGFVFTKKGTNETLSLSTNGKMAGWNTSNTGGTVWRLVDAGDDCVYIKSSKGYLAPDEGAKAGSYVYTNKSESNNAKWIIADAAVELPESIIVW